MPQDLIQRNIHEIAPNYTEDAKESSAKVAAIIPDDKIVVTGRAIVKPEGRKHVSRKGTRKNGIFVGQGQLRAQRFTKARINETRASVRKPETDDPASLNRMGLDSEDLATDANGSDRQHTVGHVAIRRIFGPALRDMGGGKRIGKTKPNYI
uniref:50S ribosomal protein L24 n=1 Tax=Panagrellus redivivus TaxID=6233 RepID=A0A7E4W416_PANRE